MKVCFVGPTLADCGGIQRVMAIVANALAERHEVTIISINNEEKVSYYELDQRIRVIYYNGFYHSKKRLIRRGIRRAAKKYDIILPPALAAYAYYPNYLLKRFLPVLTETKYDCIIGVTIYCTDLLGLLADHLKGTKLIGWHHNSFRIYFQTPKHGYYVQSELSKKVLKRLDEMVTLTRHDAEEYRRWMGIDSKYIYNPMSFCSEKKADMTEKTLLFVSRLEIEQKGLDYLVRIAEELFLNRGYRDWKLRIVGGGSGYETVSRWILEKHLEKYVELVGEQKDVAGYYVHASVFLSTSRWEGFGVVVTEAMECGLPVVAFKTDGPSEIISDGENGCLVNNYDLMQFADAVEKLMVDQNLRKKMSQKAMERAKDFYIDQIVKEWETLIEDEIHCDTGGTAEGK